ncbi:unnamed protein product [Moneuplotes crassus]|uniref:Uncharacterized protein n=1 Tax=Euplotes crassus TaxID=5936 RepID=A0AAD1UNH3_EUPCR|nr:unnamed protein product [Moneuplotes crassus]
MAYLFASGAIQLLFLAYVLVSMKLVNFKGYLKDIFGGYNIRAPFEKSSLFIYHKKQATDIKPKGQSIDESTLEEVKEEINKREDMETKLLIDSDSRLSEPSESFMYEYVRILKIERENSRPWINADGTAQNKSSNSLSFS